MMTTTENVKIVIAGGGFAGLAAAMYLDKTLAQSTADSSGRPTSGGRHH